MCDLFLFLDSVGLGVSAQISRFRAQSGGSSWFSRFRGRFRFQGGFGAGSWLVAEILVQVPGKCAGMVVLRCSGGFGLGSIQYGWLKFDAD